MSKSSQSSGGNSAGDVAQLAGVKVQSFYGTGGSFGDAMAGSLAGAEAAPGGVSVGVPADGQSGLAVLPWPSQAEVAAVVVTPEVAAVLLRYEDIATLRRTTLSLKTLHTQARDLLNTITEIGDTRLPEVVQLKEAFEWPTWREYIATHPQACYIVGRGVVEVTAEFIQNTKDPNRGGRRRLDFVVRQCGGNYCRLHPGTARTNDATPRFFNVQAGGGGSNGSGGEHPAAVEWQSLPADGVLTLAAARRVPQVDSLGKNDVWKILEEVALGWESRTSNSWCDRRRFGGSTGGAQYWKCVCGRVQAQRRCRPC